MAVHNLPSQKRQASEPKALSGWKEIASYLRKGVRTIQRYERQLALPIRRSGGKFKGSVVATKTDLDAWVSARSFRDFSRPDFRPVAKRANQLKADFLRLDSEIGLTFAGLALDASHPEKRERTTVAARNAYDAIMRLREGVELTVGQRDELDAKVEGLKRKLQSLGQEF